MTKLESLSKRIFFIIFRLLNASFRNDAKRTNNLCYKSNRWVYLYGVPNYIGDLVNIIGGKQQLVGEPEYVFCTLSVIENLIYRQFVFLRDRYQIITNINQVTSINNYVGKE